MAATALTRAYGSLLVSTRDLQKSGAGKLASRLVSLMKRGKLRGKAKAAYMNWQKRGR